MRMPTFGILAVLLAVLPTVDEAQQASSTATAATDVTSAAVQAAIKRALDDLKPGVSVSDHLISLPDMGKYNVGVAAVARPAGTFQSYLTHDKIAEIYYVLRGSGVQVTGTMVNGTRGANVSRTIGPGMSSSSPLQNPRTIKLGPGDVQFIPPGLGHGFTSIDPGGIEYLIFRIDPEHVLGMQ